MRLADFILENTESILAEWETFARGVWPGEAKIDATELRDHAADILRATGWDMKSAQTATQQSDKSKGDGDPGADSARVDGASDVHAVGRVRSGFDLLAVVAEYRALRASVVRLWRASGPSPDLRDLEDLTRFNESIDQSLTEAIRSYTHRVDRSRQMFLAILGHDLRNPLHSIMMAADALGAEAGPGTESSQMTSRISASVHAMARMIGDLSDFTGTGLGAALSVEPKPMDLKPLCQEVVDEMRSAFPARALRFQAHGADLSGEWDAARLRQVVSNLLGNAFQHGGDGTPIDVTLSAHGSDVQIAVRNEGPPIPRNAMATIFDPLVRGDSAPESRKHRRPGSIGLGLYIAREVAVAHGGTIGVASSAEAGTVFTVTLPRHPGAG
jgi:signal transduction histidine kinase